VEGQVADIFIPGVVKGLSDIRKIGELRIGETQPTQLSRIATVDWGAATYRRAEGGYAGTVNATITADDVGRVNREVQEIIDGLVYDPDEISEIKMGGVAEQMEEGFKDMGIAIILAIVIVFVVLAISFRSWLTPLLIMFSMPLALIGAMLGLLVTGRSLGISSMMGILMLVGIVLTNAIVLLTFVEDRRKEGYNTHDALMDAGRIRLRPILMTALTTMVALVPLSLGLSEGGLIAAELGVVVIGGLFSSTLLTLLVIPVLYSLTDRFRRHPSSQRDSSVEIP
jgi:HAE1 family hydrophobic/amphiphilic exporter-1